MMLTQSQVIDALVLLKAISAAVADLPSDPEWGGGLHLRLPDVIPLRPDYEGEAPIAWLVANDFNGGYDLATTDPGGAA